MAAKSLSESRLSTGFLTVLPKEIRQEIGAREGDILQWQLKGTELIVRLRKRQTIDDITGLGSHGGDAVRSKKAVQGLVEHVR